MLKIIRTNNSRTKQDLQIEEEIEIIANNKNTLDYAIKNDIDLTKYVIINIKNLKKEDMFSHSLDTEYGYINAKFLYQPNTNFKKTHLSIPKDDLTLETKTLNIPYYVGYENDPMIDYITEQIQIISDNLRAVKNRQLIDYKNAITIMQTLRQIFTNNVKNTLKKIESLEWLIYRVFVGTLNETQSKELISKLKAKYEAFFKENLVSVGESLKNINDVIHTIKEQILFYKGLIDKKEDNITPDQEIIKHAFKDLLNRVLKQLSLFLKHKIIPFYEHIEKAYPEIFKEW